jgi:hypothetical protein
MVTDYFTGAIWTGPELVHAATVFGIVVVAEILALALAARLFAWNARHAAARDLRMALAPGWRAFGAERSAIAAARELIAALNAASKALHQAR